MPNYIPVKTFNLLKNSRKYTKPYIYSPIVENAINLVPYIEEESIDALDISERTSWSISRFNLSKIWKYTQGENIKVGVVDSGVQPDHHNLIDNILPGKNFLGSIMQDDCGHGSHCSGVVAAMNSELGVVGVAPKTKIIPVKVLDAKGSGSLENVAEGIKFAANSGVDFIVLSLGSQSEVPIVHEAIKYAVSKNIVIFCAAGNSGESKEVFYPAAYDEVIGVGACDENFNRAKFSCTGKHLQFLAPGVKILSTVPINWYKTLSGSSMAAPFCCGVCCLLLSYVRKKNINIPLKTNFDYINFLKKYTCHIPEENQFLEGHGIIDPRKLEEWIAEVDKN